jgi:hypothetical protein
MRNQSKEILEEMERVVDRSLAQIGGRITEALLRGDVERLASIERAFQEHWGYRDDIRAARCEKAPVAE